MLDAILEYIGFNELDAESKKILSNFELACIIFLVILAPNFLFVPREERLMTVSNDMLCGAVAGAVSRLLTAPLDVLKIRFQLQCRKQRKYISMQQAIRSMIREEGIWSLWKGNIPATYLWVSYSMVQFASYGFLSRFFNSTSQQSSSSVRRDLISTVSPFLSGAGAGVVATVVTYPFDIMRTQFAIQGKDVVHRSMVSYVRHTVSTCGVSGFYMGLPAAIVGIAPFMGMNFYIYEQMRIQCKVVQHFFGASSTGVLNMAISAGSGAIAGGVSKLLMYPLDTIKKRLQAQVLQNTMYSTSHLPSTAIVKYSSFINCIATVITEEGVRGLYKGIVPTLIKSVATTAVTFATFEATKSLITKVESH